MRIPHFLEKLRQPSRDRFATNFEDCTLALFCVWVTVGLAIDGYAHSTIIDSATEDFFTPWHAVLYSGFLAVAGLVAFTAFRRRRIGVSIIEWLPEGYRWSAYGVVIFAIGGFGDGVWHTIYGIETGLDALLSPTHLVTAFSMILICSAPIRAAWVKEREYLAGGRSADRKCKKAPLPVVVSVGIVTCLVSFFTSYLWVPLLTYLTTTELTVHEDERAVFLEQGYLDGDKEIGLAIAGSIVVTVVLLSGVLLLERTWRPPFGTATLIWSVSTLVAGGVYIVDGTAQHYLAPVGIAFAGGLAFDCLALLRVRQKARRLLLVTAPPFVLWATWYLAATVLHNVRWEPELWTGLIFLNVAVGLGLRVVFFPAIPTVSPVRT